MKMLKIIIMFVLYIHIYQVVEHEQNSNDVKMSIVDIDASVTDNTHTIHQHVRFIGKYHITVK